MDCSGWAEIETAQVAVGLALVGNQARNTAVATHAAQDTTGFD